MTEQAKRAELHSGPSEPTQPAADGWRLECVLPNLALAPYDENEGESERGGYWGRGINLYSSDVAIVAPSDPRAIAAAQKSPAVAALLAAFRGPQGETVLPSALMVRESAHEALHRRWEPLVAFRNAAAMSFLLKGRAGGGGGAMQPTWSDTFDFHPTVPDARGSLSTWSPALHSFGYKPERFLAMPSPHLDRVGRRLFADWTLYELLAREWARRFGPEGVDDAEGRALWRSLEHAYYALSAALKHQESVHDYGLQLGLWVSAVEILAWRATPGTTSAGRADLSAALDLLGEFQWLGEALRREQAVPVRKKETRTLNAVQLLYWHIYRARNDFMHGNPVSAETFFTHRAEGSHDDSASDPDSEPPRSLLNLAAVVYRTALVAFLNRRYPRPKDDDETGYASLSRTVFDDWDYSRAVEAGIGASEE